MHTADSLDRPSLNSSPFSTLLALSKTPSTPKIPIVGRRTSRPFSAKNANANAQSANADDSHERSGSWPWTSTGPTQSRRKRTSLRVRFHPFQVDAVSPVLSDTSIEAPPSLLPPRHYCDITGLEVRVARVTSVCDALTSAIQAPYTDPRTGLRYHDKSVYDLIKNLVRSFSPRLPSPEQRALLESQRRKRLPLRERCQSHRQVAPVHPSCSSSRHVYGGVVICILCSCLNVSSITPDPRLLLPLAEHNFQH